MSLKLGHVVAELNAFAPPALAESWDNVGLLVGDPQADVARVLLCIDYTPEVAAEARDAKADLVIAYHPPLFKPIARVTAGGASDLLFSAIRDGIAIYSPHTAWDAIDGGANDVLADVLDLTDRRPLRMSSLHSRELKLVTFVPEEHLESLATALFDAGAGRIGNYDACSFRTHGVGTFFGQAGAAPRVGEPGRLVRVPEIKLETVVAVDRLDAVIAAFKANHPYETPAFDLVPLNAPPTGQGMGRTGRLRVPADRAALLDLVKKALAVPHLLVAGPTHGEIDRAAVCAGAGGDLLDAALNAGAQLFLTGELRHHDALKAARAGVTVVCALHSNSERLTLRAILPALRQRLGGLEFRVSEQDRDPFHVR
ncbi:MAG: Nif3-like dinuclear metal center hexameric protein [Tepidisphaeraceae bacterium]